MVLTPLTWLVWTLGHALKGFVVVVVAALLLARRRAS